MVAGLVFALLPGCSRRPPVGESADVLRISQRNEPTDLDPATASLPDEFFIIRALSEGLLTPNPAGGKPLAAGASRYEVSDDGLTYRFYLRPGARWSNAEPVTAADFIASFHRVLTPATAAPKAHLFYAVKNARAFVSGKVTDFNAVGFRAEGPQMLVITLENPTPSFPLYVASGPWIPVNPRVVQQHGRHWTEPRNHVGNGPFTLAEWRPQRHIIVRRNPDYRDADEARTAEIQFIRFDSQDTEDRAYRAGQIQVTMAVPQSKLETYAAERVHELHRAPLAETRFISFNHLRPPLNDVRVRRALALAIDREKITSFVLRGGQTPAFRFLSPALIDGSVLESASAAVAAYRSEDQTFDPAEGRRLLAQAGYPNGVGFPTLELAGWVQNPVLDAIQQMWRQELGIEVHIVVQEAKVHLTALTTGSYDVAFVTNLLDVRDPVTALTDFTAGAPNNFPHWHSVPFDRALRTAATHRDPRVAATALASAEALLLQSAVVAPVYFNTQNWLMSVDVEGWQQDALWARRYNDVTVHQKTRP